MQQNKLSADHCVPYGIKDITVGKDAYVNVVYLHQKMNEWIYDSANLILPVLSESGLVSHSGKKYPASKLCQGPLKWGIENDLVKNEKTFLGQSKGISWVNFFIWPTCVVQKRPLKIESLNEQ